MLIKSHSISKYGVIISSSAASSPYFNLLITSMLLTWLHICFSIFILNDNLQTLRKHCMHISAVTGAGNTPLYGDMIFSKICFVVTFALSVFLGIHKSSCKAPRWSCSKSQVLLCRITTKINKMSFKSHRCRLCHWFPPHQKPDGHKSYVTSKFDKRLSTPKKALALCDRHLKYILYTLFGNHNCRFVFIRRSSNDIVAKKYSQQYQVLFAETHLDPSLINYANVGTFCHYNVIFSVFFCYWMWNYLNVLWVKTPSCWLIWRLQVLWIWGTTLCRFLLLLSRYLFSQWVGPQTFFHWLL